MVTRKQWRIFVKGVHSIILARRKVYIQKHWCPSAIEEENSIDFANVERETLLIGGYSNNQRRITYEDLLTEFKGELPRLVEVWTIEPNQILNKGTERRRIKDGR
jgi:hypothetical protein